MAKIKVSELIKRGDGEFTVELLKPSIMRRRRLPLTDKQARVLGFVREFMVDRLYPPTFKEIQEGLKINNPGSVYIVVVALARKGYIIRDKGRTRGIWPVESGGNKEGERIWK